MTTRTVPLLAAVALAASVGSATAIAASPPGAGTAKCGNVATNNGGQARYIRANKATCTRAKAVARRANGKAYRTSGFSCVASSGIYLCSKGKSQRVVFQYKKPS